MSSQNRPAGLFQGDFWVNHLTCWDCFVGSMVLFAPAATRRAPVQHLPVFLVYPASLGLGGLLLVIAVVIALDLFIASFSRFFGALLMNLLVGAS